MGFVIAAAIVLLILFFRIGVRVRSDGELSLAIDLGIIKIPIFPKKEKSIKISDYKIKKFRENREKQAEKERKKREKQLAKNKGKSKAQPRDEVAEDAADKKKKRDISGLVSLILELSKTFLSRFGRHLRIKVSRLVIIIGSEDAATTAVTYGAVCGAVQCFMELLDNCMHVKFPKNSEIRVIPDFTKEKTSAFVDIVFSFRIWQVFDMLIRTGIAYLKRLK